MLQPEYPLTWTCVGAHVQRQVKSFMLQPEYPLTWACVGALYKGKPKASCSSHGHVSGLVQISPYMDMCRGSVQRQVKSFMLQPEYPLTWTCFGALYKCKSKDSCSSQNIPLHGHASGLCTKASQKLHALARISPYMDMSGLCTKASQKLHALAKLQEYPLTRALYKGKSKASCSSQNIPLYEHVSGLCTKVSQVLHALARRSPSWHYMDMCRGSVQRQVKSFMLQPEYPLTWTCVGALYKGQVKRFMLQLEYPLMGMCRGSVQRPVKTCSSQNIPLHGHISGLCTKATQKLHALARISTYMDMFRGSGKSKDSCSSQNIPLHGHASGLCTKASQKLHVLARISPDMDMCRGSVQRQVKSFMLQPEYPLPLTCVGALYKGKSKASCSSQNIPLH